MVAVAIAGSAVVGAGASIYSANKASKTAKNTARENNQLQRDVYSENKAALSPWMKSGQGALGTYEQALGLRGGDGARNAFATFQSTPGYESGLREGINAFDRSAASRGRTNSGGTQKALSRYATDYSNKFYNSWLDRVGGVSDQGLRGAGALAGVGMGYADSVSANNNSAAQASGNAALAAGGAVGNIAGNAANAFAYHRGTSGYKPPSVWNPASNNYAGQY